jgi:hypothetical protein
MSKTVTFTLPEIRKDAFADKFFAECRYFCNFANE